MNDDIHLSVLLCLYHLEKRKLMSDKKEPKEALKTMIK